MLRIDTVGATGARAMTTLRLEGRLTVKTLGVLRSALAASSGRAAPVCLDLSGLSWLDDAAAAELRSLRGRLVLVGAPPLIVHLLEEGRP